jgi:tetratricopeptide (TPR) repeat protein
MQAVLTAQAAGDEDAFWQAAACLAEVQSRLLHVAETIPQVDRQELRELRDQHIALLQRLADRLEPVDLARCEAIWAENVGHLIKLNGPAHWTTRTAMHELHRVQVTRRASEEDRRHLQQAVQWHAQVMPLCDAGSLAAADAAARQAWQVRARILGPENIHTLATLHNLGLVLAQAGDLRNSQRVFQDVSRVYEQQLGAEHPSYALCLTHLADTHRELSQLDEAARVQRRALEILASSTGKQSADYARALNQLSLIEARQGDLAAALASANAAAALMAEHDEDPQYAAVLMNLAALYGDAGEHARRVELSQQAIQRLRKQFGEESLIVAKAWNNLGHAHLEMMQLDEADAALRQSLAIYDKSAGKLHPERAKVLLNLALLRQEQARLPESCALVDDALRVLAQSLGTNHPDFATALNNRAMLCVELGQWQEASRLLRQALAIQRSSLGESHPNYLVLLENSARLYSARRNRDQVRQLAEQAASVALDVLSQEHPEYGRQLTRLSEVARDVGELGLSEALARQGAKVLQDELGQRHPEYAQALGHLGRVYAALQQPDRAEAVAREGLAILAETLGQEHPSYAQAATVLGELYLERKRLDEAEPLLRAGAEVMLAKLGQKHPEYAQSLALLGELYLARGDAQQAEQILWQAANVTAAAYGQQNPRFARSLEKLVTVYEALQQPDRASQLKQQAERILSEVMTPAEQEAARQLFSELRTPHQ